MRKYEREAGLDRGSEHRGDNRLSHLRLEWSSTYAETPATVAMRPMSFSNAFT